MKIIIGWTSLVVVALLAALLISTRLGYLTWEWWRLNIASLGGSFLTILGLFVSVFMLNHQIRSSSESALSLDKVSRRNALNLDIYKGLTDRAEAVDQALSELISYERQCCWQLNSYRSFLENGTAREMHGDPQKLLDLHGQLGTAVVVLIKEIERWESAVQNFDVFRYAFSSAHYDEMSSFHRVFPLAVRLLPGAVDPVLRQAFHGAISDDLIGQFEAAFNAHFEASRDLSNFCFDLRVETQNALISHLFKRSVSRRVPEDPDVVVVNIDDSDRGRLARYFTELSPLGKSNQEAIASVRAAVSARQARRS